MLREHWEDGTIGVDGTALVEQCDGSPVVVDDDDGLSKGAEGHDFACV